MSEDTRKSRRRRRNRRKLIALVVAGTLIIGAGVGGLGAVRAHGDETSRLCAEAVQNFQGAQGRATDSLAQTADLLTAVQAMATAYSAHTPSAGQLSEDVTHKANALSRPQENPACETRADAAHLNESAAALAERTREFEAASSTLDTDFSAFQAAESTEPQPPADESQPAPEESPQAEQPAAKNGSKGSKSGSGAKKSTGSTGATKTPKDKSQKKKTPPKQDEPKRGEGNHDGGSGTPKQDEDMHPKPPPPPPSPTPDEDKCANPAKGETCAPSTD